MHTLIVTEGSWKDKAFKYQKYLGSTLFPISCAQWEKKCLKISCSYSRREYVFSFTFGSKMDFFCGKEPVRKDGCSKKGRK